MTWLQRYRCRHFVTNSIWILPVVGMVVAIAAVRLLHATEPDDQALADVGDFQGVGGKHDRPEDVVDFGAEQR